MDARYLEMVEYIKERLQVNTIYFIRKMEKGNAPAYLTEALRYVGDV